MAHEFIINKLVATAFSFLLGIWCMCIYVHVCMGSFVSVEDVGCMCMKAKQGFSLDGL